ncbi:MAG: aldo/keto reductase [Rikenellaceae bacterium]
MVDIPKIRLNNGVMIPTLGSGPGIVGYSSRPRVESECRIVAFAGRIYDRFVAHPRLLRSYVESVAHSLDLGYTLLDTSAAYGNCEQLAQAIARSRRTRDQLFVTTRVSNRAQRGGSVREELFATLRALDTDYVDLLQYHWPVTGCYLDTWREMVRLYDEGYCRAVGVANSHRHHIEALAMVSEVTPAVNQIEIHPLFSQRELVEYCQSQGVVVQAYSPLARYDDRLFRLPLLRDIAAKYGQSMAQIVLRWHLQRGVIPVVKSSNARRQRENISIFDFELTDLEMALIDGVNINARIRYDPDNCDFSIL